jgi:galactose mutarotase-like enzyme
LTTCGLTAAGAPSDDAGEQLGLHGSIAATPAEQVSWSEKWDGDDCVFAIKGSVRESSVHGPNLLLERTVTSSLHSSSFEIRDTMTNEGVRETPLMVLYHFNFGYPLLTQRSEIHAPVKKTQPIDEFSKASIAEWARFEPPVRGQKERVYFHEMEGNSAGEVTVALVQDYDNPDFGVALSYDQETLPQFVEWKMPGENHFVLGLEPSNCMTLGRAAERAQGTLQTLQPGETKSFRLKLEILDGSERVQAAIRSIRKDDA